MAPAKMDGGGSSDGEWLLPKEGAQKVVDSGDPLPKTKGSSISGGGDVRGRELPGLVNSYYFFDPASW